MPARGCEYPEILAALLEINKSRLEEPAPAENIKRIAASVTEPVAAGEGTYGSIRRSPMPG